VKYLEQTAPETYHRINTRPCSRNSNSVWGRIILGNCRKHPYWLLPKKLIDVPPNLLLQPENFAVPDTEHTRRIIVYLGYNPYN